VFFGPYREDTRSNSEGVGGVFFGFASIHDMQSEKKTLSARQTPRCQGKRVLDSKTVLWKKPFRKGMGRIVRNERGKKEFPSPGIGCRTLTQGELSPGGEAKKEKVTGRYIREKEMAGSIGESLESEKTRS